MFSQRKSNISRLIKARRNQGQSFAGEPTRSTARSRRPPAVHSWLNLHNGQKCTGDQRSTARGRRPPVNSTSVNVKKRQCSAGDPYTFDCQRSHITREMKSRLKIGVQKVAGDPSRSTVRGRRPTARRRTVDRPCQTA